MDIKKLRAVIATLEKISVSGSANLNALLACIQELEKMVAKGAANEAVD